MISPEALLKYWEENPEALEAAYSANRDVFNQTAVDEGWVSATTKLANQRRNTERYRDDSDLAYTGEGRGPKVDLDREVVAPLINQLGDNIYNPETGEFVDIGVPYQVAIKDDGSVRHVPGGGGDPGERIVYVGTEGAGQNSGGAAPIQKDYIRKDNKKQTALTAAMIAGVTPVAGIVGGALGAGSGAAAPALGSGAIRTGAGLLTGENVEDALKAGVKAGGATYGTELLANTELLNPILKAPNVGGAAARGATTEGIGQLFEGDFDAEGLLKAAAIQGGLETLGDVWKDAQQTNEKTFLPGTDQLDGVTVSPTDLETIERITNTSDLYGVLGPGGLLDKVGIEGVGYMPTDWIGNTQDFLGVTGRALENLDAAKERRQAEHDRIIEQAEAGEISWEDASAATQEANRQFLQDTARYDEREFILNQPRGDSPKAGIWEYTNEFGEATPTFFPVDPSGGDFGGMPSASTGSPVGDTFDTPTSPDVDTNLTPLTDTMFADYMSQNLIADINYQGPGVTGDYIQQPEPQAAPPQVVNEPPVSLVDDYDLLEGTFPDSGQGILPEGPDGGVVIPEGPDGGVVIPEGPDGEKDTFETPAIPGGQDDTQPDEETETTTSDGGGGGGGGYRRGPSPNRADARDHLNRLARIMQIQGLPPEIQRIVAGQFAAALGRVEGDLTAAIDSESTEYIQRMEREQYEEEQRKKLLEEYEA